MSDQQLREALVVAKDRLKQQDDLLDSLKKEAHMIATVLDVRGDRMTINANGSMDIAYLDGAKIGSQVLVLTSTFQALSILPPSAPVGLVATVVDGKEGMLEVDVDGSKRSVRANFESATGDRVVIDNTMTVALGVMARAKPAFSFDDNPSVSWDDIGGQQEAKDVLIEAVELPTRHADLYKLYNKAPLKGVLLSGPPGCGKTMLAKGAATALARVHGHERPRGFLYVKGPALLSKWVGESESQIRAMFTAARKHKKEFGYPAVIFIDEAEAILGSRDRERGISHTTVPQFLAEMDGLDDAGAMLILATNRPGDLDPAVVREGRIDRKVRVNRPDQETACKILGLSLRNRPISSEVTPQMIAADVFAQGRTIASGLRLSDAVSGAMLAGIIDQASTRAMLEDVREGRSKPAGILPEHLRWAVDRAQDSLRNLNLSNLLLEKQDRLSQPQQDNQGN